MSVQGSLLEVRDAGQRLEQGVFMSAKRSAQRWRELCRRRLKDEEQSSTAGNPTREQIHARAAAIRQAWTPEERRRRALLARYKSLRQVFAPRY